MMTEVKLKLGWLSEDIKKAAIRCKHLRLDELRHEIPVADAEADRATKKARSLRDERRRLHNEIEDEGDI